MFICLYVYMFLQRYLCLSFYFLLFCIVVDFDGAVLATLTATTSSTVSFCSCLTSTRGGCKCTKCKLSCWFQYPT